jgi:hypothetical protein
MDFKLDEEALKKDPNEVFDLLEKLGEGYVVLLVSVQYLPLAFWAS